MRGGTAPGGTNTGLKSGVSSVKTRYVGYWTHYEQVITSNALLVMALLVMALLVMDSPRWEFFKSSH